MKTKLFILVGTLILGTFFAYAQPLQPRSGTKPPADALMDGLKMDKMETSFVLSVNTMNERKKELLNRVASRYRSQDRSTFGDISNSMLSGGVSAIVNVIGTEIINLTKVRSKQKKAWMEMRQKECTFVDSLQSVKGQSDFYSQQSAYGPLDPSNMNFDGITLQANRNGKEVLRMVCHIDTTMLNHLFLHSKFHLVVDTIVFHPYQSFLPNLKANRIMQPKKGEASQDELDYWNTISQFSFDEYSSPTVNIRMDIYSSWINELVQVYQNVKLGSFNVSIPIDKKDLKDSVYVYIREKAIAEHRQPINMSGDCFIIPRSYMPVSANQPSWGTGEYKMKVVISQNCRYNPEEGRSKNWHRDYKQLVRMQNNGKAPNEYWKDIETTFRDNSSAILKATYTPALNTLPSFIGLDGSSGKAMGNAGGMQTAGGKTAVPTQSGGMGGMPEGMPK